MTIGVSVRKQHRLRLHQQRFDRAVEKLKADIIEHGQTEPKKIHEFFDGPVALRSIDRYYSAVLLAERIVEAVGYEPRFKTRRLEYDFGEECWELILD